MRKVICEIALIAILALGLYVTLSISRAEAQPADPTAYCSSLAHFAEKVAIDRDIGYTRGQVLVAVMDALGARSDSDLVFVIELVFAEPHGTPDQEAHIAFERCWTAYGRG